MRLKSLLSSVSLCFLVASLVADIRLHAGFRSYVMSYVSLLVRRLASRRRGSDSLHFRCSSSVPTSFTHCCGDFHLLLAVVGFLARFSGMLCFLSTFKYWRYWHGGHWTALSTGCTGGLIRVYYVPGSSGNSGMVVVIVIGFGGGWCLK